MSATTGTVSRQTSFAGQRVFTGNIGIKQNSPDTTLHLGTSYIGTYGDADADLLSSGGIIISNDKYLSLDNNYNINAQMKFQGSTEEKGFLFQGYYGFEFITRSSNSAMVIGGDTGNIGIGCNPSTSAKLDIELSSTGDYVNINNTNSVSSSNAVFRIDARSDLNNSFRVQRDGKVSVNSLLGIGTTDPNYPLHLYNGESDTRLRIEGTTNWDIISGGTSGTYTPANGFGIRDSNTGATRFTIDSDGTITAKSNFIVDGNFIVNGTTVTMDTATIEVEDKNIVLGNVDTPTDITANDGGITLKGDTDKTILWKDDTDSWDFNQSIKIDGAGKSLILNETDYSNTNTTIQFSTNAGQSLQIKHEIADINIIGTGQALIIESIGDTSAITNIEVSGEYYAGGSLVYNAGNSNLSTVDWAAKDLSISGAATISGTTYTNGGICQNGNTILNGSDTWLRTTGSTGWYSTTHAGGIYMTDSTYIRTYGSKDIHTDGGLSSGDTAGGMCQIKYNDTTNSMDFIFS